MTGKNRVSKFVAKYSPDTVRSRYMQTRDLAMSRYLFATGKRMALENLVRPILDEYGVAFMKRTLYYCYAEELQKIFERHRDAALTKPLLSTYEKYQIMGGDPVILTAILRVFIRGVPPVKFMAAVIEAYKEFVDPIDISATEYQTIYSKAFKHAVVLFHGDGDSSVSIRVSVNGEITEFTADKQAIELVANATLKVEAQGTGRSPTIEILYLKW